MFGNQQVCHPGKQCKAEAEHGKVAFSVGVGTRRSTWKVSVSWENEVQSVLGAAVHHLPSRWVIPTRGVPVLAARRVWVGAAQHQWDIHGSSDLLREILLWIFTRLLLLTVFSFFYFLRLSPCFISCFTLAVTFPLRFSLFTSCLCLFPSSCVSLLFLSPSGWFLWAYLDFLWVSRITTMLCVFPFARPDVICICIQL